MVKRSARVVVESGKPLRFPNSDSSLVSQPDNPAEVAPANPIGRTFRSYLNALKQLLGTRYDHAREAVHSYMRSPCQITIVRCTDALFVRYDVVDDEEQAQVRVLAIEDPLQVVAPMLSESVIHAPSDPEHWVAPDGGPVVVMSVVDAAGQVTKEVLKFSPKLLVSPHWPSEIPYPQPPARPSPIVSLVNEFDFELAGVLEDDRPVAPREIRADATHFKMRSTIALATGWSAIEVYPLLHESHWVPEAAPQWAETDLLFALFQRNSREGEVHSIDSRAEKRRQVVALLTEFETLLAGPEEPVHQFLKQNPILLYPTYDRIWSKVPFGNYVSDFVVRESANEYILVEIEAPYRQLFRRDGHMRHELTHAIGQVTDWLAYLADHRAQLEAAYDMQGIGVSPRALVVIGRSTTLSDELRRKVSMIESRQSGLWILTYDDVLSNARRVFERILGPLSLITVGNARVYFHAPKSE